MINISGLLIIFCGFAAPFLSGGQMPSVLFFWVGFLLLLWPNRYFLKTSPWLKWARIGLLLNILGTLFLLLFVYIVTHSSLSHSYFVSLMLNGVTLIVNPISTIYDFLFPYNQIIMPDGSIQSTVSFFRATATSFCNVLTYILIGIALGKIITNKRTRT